MRKTDGNSLAAVEFQLHWKSDHGTHTDCYFAEKVNFWRDILPKPLLEKLMNRSVGDSVEQSFGAGEILPGPILQNVFASGTHSLKEIFGQGRLFIRVRDGFIPKAS
jgi:hypothetical protein